MIHRARNGNSRNNEVEQWDFSRFVALCILIISPESTDSVRTFYTEGKLCMICIKHRSILHIELAGLPLSEIPAHR